MRSLTPAGWLAVLLLLGAVAHVLRACGAW